MLDEVIAMHKLSLFMIPAITGRTFMAKRRKAKRRKAGKTAKRRVARARRIGRLASARSTNPLLKQMVAYRAGLLSQQAALQTEIEKLAEAISALGGSAAAGARPRRTAGRRRKRAGTVRKGSLKSYILKVMRPGQVMAVRDIAAAVRRGGYKTQSSNFANQVSNALAQTPGVRKVSRGKFRV